MIIFGRINSIFNKIKSVDITISSLFYSLISIIIIRTFLENILEERHLINLNLSFYLLMLDFFHIVLSWLTLYLLVTFILYIFSNDKLIDVFKISLFGFIVIISVPLLDYFVFSSGIISYEHSFNDFLHSYISLFNPYSNISFVTFGVRVEIFFILISVFLYVVRFGKIKAFLALFFIYNIIFLYGYLPSFYNIFLVDFRHILSNSVLAPRSDIFINLYMYIPITLFLFLMTYFFYTNIFKTVLRIERLTIYLGLYIFGVLVGLFNSFSFEDSLNFFDASKIIAGGLSIVFAFIYAVIVNDISDISIDKDSNSYRCLITQEINIDNFKGLQPILIFLTLGFSLSVNQFFIFAVLPMLALSYIYSAQPIRARRHFISANIILSVNAIIVFLSGYVVVYQNIAFLNVDKEILLSIFLFFIVSASFKDIKDADADKINGIVTLSTLAKPHAYIILKVLTTLVSIYVLSILKIPTSHTYLILSMLIIGTTLIKKSENFLIFLQLITCSIYFSYLYQIV
ncbi:MAG: UbiA family prenyltransferase [Campylobacterota bacterium]|nr:UbiA family prenyltransferase [Campylobacterota bacterium]